MNFTFRLRAKIDHFLIYFLVSFNISILKQVTFKIIYISFSVTTDGSVLLFDYYKITLNNLYQEVRFVFYFYHVFINLM